MNTRTYRNYSDQDIIKYAKESTSMRQLLKKLDLRPTGGNYANMKRNLQKLEVDCEHWTGKAWNKDQRLKDWSEYSSSRDIKPHLLRERGHECEHCNLTEWQDQPIPLEVDHINGDRTDNREENLRLLCCNCHALTPTWRGRKNTNGESRQLQNGEGC